MALTANHRLIEIPRCIRSLIASLMFACAPGLVSGASSFEEADLKAAFLYNFGDFITWPANADGNARRDLNYCVLSETPVQRSLQTLLSQERDDEIRRRYYHIQTLDEISDCHLLFLTAETDDQSAAISQATDHGVLLVGDEDGFLEAGGMILLARDESRIRVHINTKLVSELGFLISSQLMRLVNVYEKEAQ